MGRLSTTECTYLPTYLVLFPRVLHKSLSPSRLTVQEHPFRGQLGADERCMASWRFWCIQCPTV